MYLLDKNNRLQPVTVAIAFFQENLAVIESGLTGGETLLVSDPTPAISGMLVSPVAADGLQKSLLAEAHAETELQ